MAPNFHQTFIESGLLRRQRLEAVAGLQMWVGCDFEAIWRGCEALPGCEGANPPYWSALWPGGLALATHVIKQPELMTHARVLDLGAGSGVCALAARKAGASYVLAADIDPQACAAVRLNAQLNSLEVDVTAEDVLAQPAVDFDVILAGDLWYERFFAHRVSQWLYDQAQRGVTVWLGDSGRAHFPRSRTEELASYQLEANPQLEASGQVHGKVHRFKAR